MTANRELANQINEQLSIYGVNISLRTCCLTGGADSSKQISEINKIPHIIVATPGRLVDLFEKS